MSASVPTTCWECSICCGALLRVEEGRVTEVAPNREHPGKPKNPDKSGPEELLKRAEAFL